MNQLTYNMKHEYRILQTIYQTEDESSIFYKAFDEVEKRTVGIKSLQVSKKDLDKVKAEAYTLHRFATKGKHIPALYHTYYDEQNKRFYLIMQLIESGRTLEQMMQGTITYKQAINVIIQLCDALIPLHRDNFQHRDLKPANIMIDHNQLYLIDFNLTTSIPFKGEGTLYYRAPEQDTYVLGAGHDRVDIFSIGVLLYEMVTGQVPVIGRDYAPTRDGSNWRVFVTPKEKNPQVPDEISTLIEKCMHLDAKKRPRDARELKRMLIPLRRRIK